MGRRPIRVTRPLLDVLEVLFQAFDSPVGDLHGWAIMKATKRSGPTVYGVLDRLEDIGWISGQWEEENPEPGKPRRRLYSITPTGLVGAREILRERRPRRFAPGAGRPARRCPAGSMLRRRTVRRDCRDSARHRGRAARQ